MVACKQGLNPRTLIGIARQTMQKNGLKRLEKIEAKPLMERDLRRLTTARLRHKLDLEKYNNPSPLNEEEVKVDRLYVSLRQNIGVISSAIVKEGQEIKREELLAEAPENSLGLPIHSPVDGKIIKVTDESIIIKSAERSLPK